MMGLSVFNYKAHIVVRRKDVPVKHAHPGTYYYIYSRTLKLLNVAKSEDLAKQWIDEKEGECAGNDR